MPAILMNLLLVWAMFHLFAHVAPPVVLVDVAFHSGAYTAIVPSRVAP